MKNDNLTSNLLENKEYLNMLIFLSVIKLFNKIVTIFMVDSMEQMWTVRAFWDYEKKYRNRAGLFLAYFIQGDSNWIDYSLQTYDNEDIWTRT